MRFQLRDPVRQLRGLEKLVVLLQIVGANPEKLEINPRKPPSATVVNASIGGAFSNGGPMVRPSWSRSRFNDFCTWPEPNSSARPAAAAGFFWRARSLVSLRRRQFTPVEQRDADDSRQKCRRAAGQFAPNAAPSSPQ
jgi:hypothetical protein